MQLSKQAHDLFTPKRYKIFYGGRAGTKSWDFAGALLLQGTQRKMFNVCGREVQNSIKQSVHRLLKNRIQEDDTLQAFYEVQDQKIVGKNGTEFIFVGLRQQSVDNLKSLEGCDVLWIEEGQTLSQRSLEVIIPTIRKKGSEIWISFNPKYETDPVWKLTTTLTPENSIVRKVSWRDNPWFKDTPLEEERVRMQSADPVAYRHIWEGEFDERFQGSVFASQIKAAREAGRIISVPVKTGVPVHTVWDIGKSDATSIWFLQIVGREVRFVDFFEANNQEPPFYAEILREKKYVYGRHFLPHDAKHDRIGMVKSVREQFCDLGVLCTTEDVTKATSDSVGIAAGRLLLGECLIDENRCSDGIHCLNNWHFTYNEDRKMFSDAPLHDWSSHASEAFCKYAPQAIEKILSTERIKPVGVDYVGGRGRTDGWMG